MNWTRVALAGASAGVVSWIVGFVLHGIVMAETYKRLSQVYTQIPSNPMWFLVVAVAISLMSAHLFARTRAHWAAGPKGGLTYGFCLGLVLFFQRFYDPLVIDGYPYYLAWCQGGIAMIECLLAGAVLGAVIKE